MIIFLPYPPSHPPSSTCSTVPLCAAYTGVPTEQFLPMYVRKVLKDFFRDQGVLEPKMLMILQDEKNYDLCFSLESLRNPPQAEHAGVAEAISWFLPPHYSVVLISEQNLPSFVSLDIQI